MMWISAIILMASLCWLCFRFGYKAGRRDLLRTPVEYPGLPDNFGTPPTYEDFKNPRIAGIKLPGAAIGE